MTTSNKVLREIAHEVISNNSPRHTHLEDIYQEVESRIKFDPDDLLPPLLHGRRVKEPSWKRNVRNALQGEKNNLRLVNYSKGTWGIPCPLGSSERIDEEKSWELVLSAANLTLNSNVEFQSPGIQTQYRVLNISDTSISIETIHPERKSIELEKKDVFRAVSYLNAAGGSLSPGTLNYRKMKEEIIVELHPRIQRAIESGQIEFIRNQSFPDSQTDFSGENGAQNTTVERVPVELHTTDHFEICEGNGKTGSRTEQPMVRKYQQQLEDSGHMVCRHRYNLPTGKTLYCDLFDETTGTLYEAKSSSGRKYIREAVGQLFEYRYLEENSGECPNKIQLAILIPDTPEKELIGFLKSLEIDHIIATENT